VIYPIAFRRLLQVVSFGWAVRILAFIVLATCLIPIAVLKVRVPPTSKRKLTFAYMSFFRDPPYGLFTLSMVFTMAAQYIPAFYIQEFAEQQHLMSNDLASYLLPILNTASILGRVVPNLFADNLGPLNTLIPCILVTMVLAFTWISVHSAVGLIIFAIFYGFLLGQRYHYRRPSSYHYLRIHPL
jgi:predicted MFS family arabinose efflux permease